MSPTIVYRIEHKVTGDGPWSDGWGWDAGYVIPNTYNAFPTRSCRQDEYHGFNKRGHVNFFSFRDQVRLHAEGYHLATYMVPPGTIRYGKKQVLFVKHKAMLVETSDFQPTWRTIFQFRVN